MTTPSNGNGSKLGSPTAWIGLFTSLITAAYTAGFQSAELKAAQETIRDLRREIRYLQVQVRRLQGWPSRSTAPTTKTDEQ